MFGARLVQDVPVDRRAEFDAAVGKVLIPPVRVVVEFEFEFEFDSEPPSEHAPVRADMRDRRHALRFISW